MTKQILNKESRGIVLEGKRGTWYVIDSAMYPVGMMYLLESEQFGEDVECVIVNSTGHIVLDNICNGFDDLDEHWDNF